MKKKKILKISLCVLIGILILLFVGSIGTNKFINTNYTQLNDTDQKMLTEYNELYQAFQTESLWKDFDFNNKTIIAVSKDNLNAYMINPKNTPSNLLSKKLICQMISQCNRYIA